MPGISFFTCLYIHSAEGCDVVPLSTLIMASRCFDFLRTITNIMIMRITIIISHDVISVNGCCNDRVLYLEFWPQSDSVHQHYTNFKGQAVDFNQHFVGLGNSGNSGSPLNCFGTVVPREDKGKSPIITALGRTSPDPMPNITIKLIHAWEMPGQWPEWKTQELASLGDQFLFPPCFPPIPLAVPR